MPRSRHTDPVTLNHLLDEYNTLAGLTAFNQLELRQMFSEAEVQQINALLAELAAATSDQQKQAVLINHIDSYAGVVLRLLRVLAKIAI